MKNFRIPLRVVFYKEDGSWIAHCLEFDLCGDGATKVDALRQLTEAIAIQLAETLENGNLRNLFSPASGDVQEKFFAGKNTALGELHWSIENTNSIELSEPECREYCDDASDSDHELATA